jgi:hypothetical protein
MLKIAPTTLGPRGQRALIVWYIALRFVLAVTPEIVLDFITGVLFKPLSGKKAMHQPVSISARSRRILESWGAWLPAKLEREEIGDALEKIDRLAAAGASAWAIRGVVLKTIFWTTLHAAAIVAVVLKFFGRG